MRLPNPLAPLDALGALVDRVAVPGRRRRRTWVGDGRAHVEVKGVHRPELADLARHVEKALEELAAVDWAQVNPITGSVVVAFDPESDPEATDLEALIDTIEGVEETHGVDAERFPADRPEPPGDVEPLHRNVIALVADVLGLGASGLGQVLRATPFPVELASVVSLLESQPRLRKVVEDRLGYAATDLGLGLSSALAQALTQGPLGLVVSCGSRASQVGELSARRRVWEQREPELAGSRHDVPLPAIDNRIRPVPLPRGAIETVADGVGLASIGVFGAGLVATRSPRQAANLLVAGIPRASSMGREVFAAHLGRELSRRGTLVLDRSALRRLDRIDTLVVDATVLATGRPTLDRVEPLGDTDASQARQLALAALEIEVAGVVPDDSRPRFVALDELQRSDVPGLHTRVRPLTRVGAIVRAVRWRDDVVAVAAVIPELDPLAAAMARSATASGYRVVVAGDRHAFAARLGVGTIGGHDGDLDAVIGALQRDGRVVMLVSDGGQQQALATSDCGIGLTRPNEHAPWGADLVAARGLEDAWFAVEAAKVARDVSRRSALLSLAGSAAGGALSFVGPRRGSGRRAVLPVNAAAMVAEASGFTSAVVLARHQPPRPQSSAPWHAMDADAVLAALGSSSEGLDDAEARVRVAATPPPLSRPRHVLRAVAGELTNPLTPVLGLGAGLAAAVGSASDALLVGGTVMANAVISGAQRVRTESSIERLGSVSETGVTVRRNGRTVSLAPDALVRGDVVELASGDLVPADCRILEADGCEVDESVLTGESLPVRKEAASTPGAAVAERACMLYEGTTVVAGGASAVVAAVGRDTEQGSALAGAPEPPPSGVEARLAGLTRAVIPVTFVGGAAVTGLSVLRRRSLREAVGTGVSLMVAAVPEGLPMLATVAQLSAAQRLATRNALVRNPRTIEALGRVDVLCFDKTGTLTAGRIALQRVSDGAHDEVLDELSPGLRTVLAAAVRASPALDDEDTLPHATDQAVVEAAERVGVGPADGLGGWHQVGELPFASSRGFHAAVGRGPTGAVIAVKGAPETVLPRCDHWRGPTGLVPVSDRRRARLEGEAQRLASKGLRVLAVAQRESSPRAEIDESRVTGMTLLGFLGFADHVRPTAAAAIDEILRAGVEIVMITGDHPATAEAIAGELSILNGHRVVTGAEIDEMDDDALVTSVANAAVFARVTPAHKVRIVQALQASGRVVAMTGDGANDAAAIRLAHAGIAVGRRGSPAARDAADLVVTDDHIETIIEAIVEGRAMWASVRDALAILLGGNLGEIGFTVGATALTGASPLNARQLLVVNLLTDMLPAMAIALRPPARRSPDVLLHEGPEASLGTPLLRQIGLRASTTAMGAGSAWLVARATGTRRRASTVALAALVGTQLGQTAVAGGTSPVVLASTLASGAALAVVVQTPGVSQFLGCTPLGPVGWTIAGGASAAATIASVVLPWAAGRMLPRTA